LSLFKQARKRIMQTQPLNSASAATAALDIVPVVRTTAPMPARVVDVPTSKRIEEAVGEANRAMKSIDATLQFEVDPDTNITVIKVIDTDGKTVLRQVPAQEMLEIAQSLDRLQGLLLREEA
jgi:flagellar protein FlaG